MDISPEKFDSFINSIVGSENNLKGQDISEKYNKGYRYGMGNAFRVVRPRNSQEAAKILKFCNENSIKVIAQGGNTGLVGSSITDNSGSQIILSTELLNNKKIEINEKNLSAKVGAGVILDDLNSKLSEYNLFFPIDIGSSGSCNIGGVISTNAAGTRAGFYGNAKTRTISVTVALPNGALETFPTVHQSKFFQDNSSIDENNPFIGSSGWLGVIVETEIKLANRTYGHESALLVPSSDESIPKIIDILCSKYPDKLSAIEGIPDSALRLVAKHIPKTPYLFENDAEKKDTHDFSLLIELSTDDKNFPLKREIENIFAEFYEMGLVVTGRDDKPELFWHVRHHISEAISKEGSVIATDIAIPDRNFLSEMRRSLSREIHKKWPHIIIVPFGHEMIGAVHFNLVWPKNHTNTLTNTEKQKIQEFIYDFVISRYNGTFSAEHGIGPHNQWAYDKYTNDIKKHKAAELKAKFDSNNIMNPNLRF